MKNLLVGVAVVVLLFILSALIVINFRIYPYYCWISGSADDMCVGSGPGG